MAKTLKNENTKLLVHRTDEERFIIANSVLYQKDIQKILNKTSNYPKRSLAKEDLIVLKNCKAMIKALYNIGYNDSSETDKKEIDSLLKNFGVEVPKRETKTT